MLKDVLRFRLSGGFTLLELMAVVGVFGLTVAVSGVLLTTSRNYGDFNEAKLQAKESARIALERINQELRLSSPSKVSISNLVSWAPSSNEPQPGSVINFQIPVGIYSNLDLTSSNELKWGSAFNEGSYLAYSVNGNSQLVKSTYTSASGANPTTELVSNHIGSITFSRTDTSSSLIRVVITAIAIFRQNPISESLTVDIKLRN